MEYDNDEGMSLMMAKNTLYISLCEACFGGELQ